MFSADFTQAQVLSPSEHRCKSCTARGVKAPEAWERLGPGKGFEKTRFFRIQSTGNPSINGVYCEPCLVVARAMSDVRKYEEKQRR